MILTITANIKYVGLCVCSYLFNNTALLLYNITNIIRNIVKSTNIFNQGLFFRFCKIFILFINIKIINIIKT